MVRDFFFIIRSEMYNRVIDIYNYPRKHQVSPFVLSRSQGWEGKLRRGRFILTGSVSPPLSKDPIGR